MGFPGGSLVKNPPANAGAAGNAGLIPWFDALEEEMATHSNIFTGIIPWTEGSASLPGGGGYSPWGHKESGRTDPLSTHTRFIICFAVF